MAELNSQPNENRLARFCEYWALKESYIKASGKGLSIHMDFSFQFPATQLPSGGFTPDQIFLARRNDPDGGALQCRSWLLPAADNLRIATSLLGTCEPQIDNVRCFVMIPLQEHLERSLPLI